jgi:hypothetical protein
MTRDRFGRFSAPGAPEMTRDADTCANGHRDWFIHTDGRRRCKTCLREKQRVWLAAKRASVGRPAEKPKRLRRRREVRK